MMMFLAVSDFFTNMATAIQEWFVTIGNMNWVDISTQIKNWALTGGGAVAIGYLIKYGVPFFKNSNKPILQQLGVQLEITDKLLKKIDLLETSQQTVGNVLTDWIGLQSEVNVVSKTLTDEQKQKFVALAEKMKLVGLTAQASKIEEIVKDNVVTATEVKELVESTKIGEKVLGTSINNIVSRG